MEKLDINEYLKDALGAFDSIELDTPNKKRVAINPLYDYFQALVLETAVTICGFNKNAFKSTHLMTRWIILASALELVDRPDLWINFIKNVCYERNEVDHYDEHVPEIKELMKIRGNAETFGNWLIAAAKKYRAESNGFSFLQEFMLRAKFYIVETESNLAKYGENPPYSFENIEKDEYLRLKNLNEKLNSRIKEINAVNMLTREDIDILIELAKQAERLEAREKILLRFGICAKCGSKVSDTQTPIGGAPEGPPDHIMYRTGCDKCDYELNSETIDI